MADSTPRLAMTTGEPAGIGPDVVLAASQSSWPGQLVAIGDRSLLEARAAALGIDVTFVPYSSIDTAAPHAPGSLPLIEIPLGAPCTAGQLNSANAGYVLAQLEMAVTLCRSGECDGMVTAPVHKGVINDAGIPFSGHTEFLASATKSDHVVMMLATGDLRVALATTHIPLRDVPDALPDCDLEATLRTLHHSLTEQFGFATPRITVLGLNPHAGEGGHLGRDEIELITPLCDTLRAEGMHITGPVPADSAFIPAMRAQTDAYLAMYHDQGLPVLKAVGFQGAVNITLGLPIIRTSVDHGTALELAGTGEADSGSLEAAINAAFDLCRARAI